MNRALPAVVLALSCAGALADETLPLVRSFDHAGRERRALVHLPGGRAPTSPAPLVLALHGSGQTARSFSAKRGPLIRRASEEGIVLVFPQSTELAGKTRWVRQEMEDAGDPIDDLGFLLRLIEVLEAEYAIDAKRVYATGFSSGALFCHELGARATSTFAAIAPVAGSLPAGLPKPGGPIPILIVNGRRDPVRPYDGGPNEEGAPIASVADTVHSWTTSNGCAERPEVEAGKGVRIERYSGDAEVVLVALARMDHQWPDASEGFGWDANREILEFFARHARP